MNSREAFTFYNIRCKFDGPKLYTFDVTGFISQNAKFFFFKVASSSFDNRKRSTLHF